MKAGFIGAGKVGFSLGKYLVENGISVTGYFSRNQQIAEEAARFTDTICYQDLAHLVDSSDTLFLTVPDRAISEVWDCMRNLPIENKNICHCSGSISSTAFFFVQKNTALIAIPFIRSVQSAINIHPIKNFLKLISPLREVRSTCRKCKTYFVLLEIL